jgi:hypothetical protein
MPDQTGQVHAKLMREVADEIAEEAKRRGVQQGVLIDRGSLGAQQKAAVTAVIRLFGLPGNAGSLPKREGAKHLQQFEIDWRVRALIHIQIIPKRSAWTGDVSRKTGATVCRLAASVRASTQVARRFVAACDRAPRL